LSHSELADYWELPTLFLSGGETPGEAALRQVNSLGLVPSRLRPIGGFRDDGLETLVLGYRIEVEGGSSSSGLFLPLHLAPLNCDPRHIAIARRALATMDPVEERLGPANALDHLASLRSHEEPSRTYEVAIASFLEIVNFRLKEARGFARAPWLERLAELMMIDGRPHVASDLLAEAFSLASQADDKSTMARADIRLAELEGPVEGEMRAWWWVSELSTPGAFAYLDIPFAYLGAYANRRHRTSEAEAYFRRALVLSEDSGRRAWIKSAMTSKPVSAARVTA
jgi:hypothetical protein